MEINAQLKTANFNCAVPYNAGLRKIYTLHFCILKCYEGDANKGHGPKQNKISYFPVST